MKISVVIPTYTGIEHLTDCLRSIFGQTQPPDEIIIVIDGPGIGLRQKVNDAVRYCRGQFGDIETKIYQNKQNLGRFKTRLKGAQSARYDRVVFVDDRVKLKNDYLQIAKNSKYSFGLTRVEVEGRLNIIEATNESSRKRVFGNSVNKSFLINKKNFDSLPKGTTSFWVEKNAFIDSCERLASTENTDRHMSDDTKLLKDLVENHNNIYRDNNAVVYYYPRQRLSSSFKHLLQRGPKFVDYYLHPGRRYFWPLVFFYILLIPFLVLLVLYPLILPIILAVSVIGGLWSTDKINSFLKVWLGLWLVALTFGAGLVWGLFKKAPSIYR